MKKISLSLLLTVLLSVMLFVSCDNKVKEPEIYTVTFDTAGGTAVTSQKVEKGGKVMMPSSPTRDGYDFRGWYKDGEAFNFNEYTVTADITLTAKWSARSKTYIVAFDSNKGSAVPFQSVSEGGKASRPTDPTKEGCVFWGWYKNEEDADSFDFDKETITSDIILYAFWMEEIETVTVTFDSAEGSAVEPQTVAKGYMASKPENPTRAGYEFDGWYNGDNVFDFDTKITGDLTLTAHWTAVPADTFTVTFDSDGGTAVASQKVKKGEKATKPANPQKEGFEFDGWYNGANVFNFETQITSDITLKATWHSVSTECTVTFKVDDDSVYCTQKATKWSKIVKPNDPTKTGLYFLYWTKSDGSEFKFDSDLISENTTLTAKWDNTEYFTVSFNTDGGTAAENQRVKKGEKAKEPDTKKEGYIKAGWVDDETLRDFSFNTPINSDMSLTVKWEYKSYTVAFDSNGGTEVTAERVKAGGTAYRPKNPTKEVKDYQTFGYWSLDGEEYDFNSPVNGNITLKAVWRDYKVGDIGPAGGYIFYDCDADNNSGNEDGLKSSECGWRFLEAAKNDLPRTMIFGDQSYDSWGTRFEIGTGKKNTEILKEKGGRICASYYILGREIDGFSDWYIPSRYELNAMYLVLAKNGLGNFKKDKYWSSSEVSWSAHSASYQNFADGEIDVHLRTTYDYIRPIRSF